MDALLTPAPAPIDAPARAGATHPIGASLAPDGVNVSVYAKRATSVELVLFDTPESDAPSRTIALDADEHRTGPYWHAVRARPRGRPGATASGSTARGHPSAVSGSTASGSSSTRTVAASPYRPATAAGRPGRP
jgi:hypothetical protein